MVGDEWRQINRSASTRSGVVKEDRALHVDKMSVPRTGDSSVDEGLRKVAGEGRRK